MKKFVLLLLMFFMMYPQSIQAIKYIENKTEETSLLEEGKANQSLKEGLAQEDIVMQITADGYVTSHGDHYHYYNGLVPYDAIVSEELLVDSNYRLNKEHIINEIKDGYVVKVDEKYFLYYEDKDQASNLRSKNEVKLQTNGLTPQQASSVNSFLKNAKTEKFIYFSTSKKYKEEYPALSGQVVFLFDQGYVYKTLDDVFIITDLDFPVSEVAEDLIVSEIDNHVQIIESKEAFQIVKISDGTVKIYKK